MGTVEIHARARADLDDIWDYIAQRNLTAAIRFQEAARRTFDLIAAFPRGGTLRPIEGRPDLDGMRIWPIPRFRKYVVFYNEIAGGARVMRILHGARDIPRTI
ncbi:MAG: type II toxin-antitoxin system RelE/ParE family toxin [Phycisphaerae bacterium]|nr:type II toxin-antitoxin system RelE/ParE family toxin [Tepidisphaeraceae bacterium]